MTTKSVGTTVKEQYIEPKKRYIELGNRAIPIDSLDTLDTVTLEEVYRQLLTKQNEIISNRCRFQNENTFPKNDNRYWNKMNSYRYALLRTQDQIRILTAKLKERHSARGGQENKFCYMFYRIAQKCLPENEFKAILDNTINVLELTNQTYTIPTDSKETRARE